MSQLTYDLSAVRLALPALKDITYLNTGTEGIMAEPVRVAYLEMVTYFEQYGHYARELYRDEMALVRSKLAALINAQPDEVTVTHSGTEGVSTVLGCLSWNAGDEIVIGNEEHPAIRYPAFALQARLGVKVRIFRFARDPAETLESFRAALSPRTRVAAFSHVSCETGIRMPAKQMIDLAHAQGIPVLLDGAQSFGSFPVDVRALGCDYFTGSAHKWLCGPKGSGLLMVRQDRLADLVPPYVGGGSLAEPFPYELLDTPEAIAVQFRPSASRFEYGMRNPVLSAGISRAIDYLNGIGFERIADHERAIGDYLKRRLAETPGVTLLTPVPWEHSSAIVTFALEGIPGNQLSTRLWNEYKVIQRSVREPDGVRISCAYFVGEEDVDRLIGALKAIRAA